LKHLLRGGLGNGKYDRKSPEKEFKLQMSYNMSYNKAVLVLAAMLGFALVSGLFLSSVLYAQGPEENPKPDGREPGPRPEICAPEHPAFDRARKGLARPEHRRQGYLPGPGYSSPGYSMVLSIMVIDVVAAK
jgi:hypothetical protein